MKITEPLLAHLKLLMKYFHGNCATSPFVDGFEDLPQSTGTYLFENAIVPNFSSH